MSRTIEDIVREVEQADVKQLERIDVENVYQQMDHMLEERPTPLELYNRWEKQQWAVQDLDFTQDKQHWANLFEPIRDFLQNTFTLFFIGEQAVTDTLAPLVGAAPTEEDRIFLSTQIVDEARHAVFFKRFFEDVVGVGGGLSGALAAVKDDTVAGFRKIFDHELLERTDRVRREPHSYEAWVEGIVTYHLIIEGMLALTGQKISLRTIRNAGILPAFYAGFTAVTRDESRHVNYGVGAVRDAVQRGLAGNVENVVSALLEPACWTIFAPDRDFGHPDITPEMIPEPMRVSPREVQDFSLFSLTKRLRVVGLSKEFCDSVTDRGNAYYDACLAQWESSFGREHPIRWYDDQAKAS